MLTAMKMIAVPFVRAAIRLVFIFSILPFLYLLKPYRRVVLHKLIYNRIGHLAGNSDFALRQRQISAIPPNEIHIFVSGPPVNRQLFKMLQRHLIIFESAWLIRLFFIIEDTLRKTPFYEPDTWQEFDCLYEIATTQRTLFFSAEEECRGQQALEMMGIGSSDWFVCVHSRDSLYLQETNPSGDWNYHDYRDCSIANYLPAMNEITARGGYVLRMGALVSEPLEHQGNPMIIDYASDHRSDFMDIYATAKCRFFLGSTGGLFNVAWVFDVPIAHANMTPLSVLPFRSGDLFIPKLLRNTESHELIDLNTAFAHGLFNPQNPRLFTSDYYKNINMEFVENSSDEILALTREMFSKLDHSKVNPAVRSYQKAYKARFLSHIDDWNLVGDISWYFLKKHIKIIDLGISLPDIEVPQTASEMILER
ncbi:MAG: hypothetical protein CBB68_06625 [Rhodospirillaceae bacterium TMED8]|nr:hypothetical protein [Magnetovibrio sp.]OUT51290.1 MAG: hypothetical protein CBB68_06625 [Rhodospirillaceae bacterium TMED8]|tara:strand:+ start:1285 stop:2550 length:1266 start_codon:yes stop_codon:yes gene_type:complete